MFLGVGDMRLMEALVPVPTHVEMGGLFDGGAREQVELKEVFVFFFEGPKKEGKPVLVKDLPLECHNPPVKAAARSCGCLSTMEVV